MEMFYRDMRGVVLRDAQRSITFRIEHGLQHFGADYDHTNAQHAVTISLASGSDFQKLRSLVHPMIKAQQGGGGGGGGWRATSTSTMR